MDEDIKGRFDKIDKRLKEHCNDDHHVILERFKAIDKSISHLNSKNVGYAAVAAPIIIFILNIITVIL